VAVDFYQKPYATGDMIESGQEAKDPIIPIIYYDNDDGFWDKYLDDRIERWDENDVLTNRKFFKH